MMWTVLKFLSFFCVVSIVLNISEAKSIRVSVRENITIPCPNTNSDVVDRESLRFQFDEVASTGEHSFTSDTLTFINGKQTSIVRFPGCYRVNVRFRLRRPLAHPYIETSLRMGTALPCESTQKPSTMNDNICTNITRPVDWCPKSGNEKLRSMTRDQPTCRFCNLCEQAQQSDPVARRYVSADKQTVDSCGTDQLEQSFDFQVCTPDRKTMHKANEDSDGKYDKYFDYLKQGVLSIIVHISDRRPLTTTKTRQCERLCSTMNGGAARSNAYRSTLDRTISSVCTPEDTYVACILNTIKFDVLDPIV